MKYSANPNTKVDGEILVREYFKNPTEKRRDKVIKAFLPLVKQIAGRMNVSDSTILMYADLVQTGLIGLVEALNRYNITMGVRFKSFAYTRIHGAIVDEIRKAGVISRGKLTKLMNIENEKTKLTNKLGRFPSDYEVCLSLGIEEEDYHKLMNVAQLSYSISLEEEVDADDESTVQRIEVMEDPDAPNPEDMVMKKALTDELKEIIMKLPERERLTLVLYYYEELTLKEIAQVLGVTESRISQILNKTLMNIRIELNKE